MHVIQHVDKSYKTLRHSLVSIQISFIVLNPIYLFTLLLLKRSDLESPRTYRPCAYVLYVTLSCFQSANPSKDCSKKIQHYSSFTCFLWKSNHTSNIEIFLQRLLWISLLSHTLCLFLHLLNSPFPSQNYHLIKPNFSSLTTSPTFLSTFLSQFVGVYFPSASPTIKVIQSKHPARASCVICQGDSNALFLFIFKQCLHYQYIK